MCLCMRAYVRACVHLHACCGWRGVWVCTDFASLNDVLLPSSTSELSFRDQPRGPRMDMFGGDVQVFGVYNNVRSLSQSYESAGGGSSAPPAAAAAIAAAGTAAGTAFLSLQGSCMVPRGGSECTAIHPMVCAMAGDAPAPHCGVASFSAVGTPDVIHMIHAFPEPVVLQCKRMKIRADEPLIITER
jgi:hypothetical protein